MVGREGEERLAEAKVREGRRERELTRPSKALELEEEEAKVLGAGPACRVTFSVRPGTSAPLS